MTDAAKSSEQLKARLQAKIEGAFAAAERIAEANQPGILDILKAYGGYERALAETEAYLHAMDVPPVATLSDCSLT